MNNKMWMSLSFLIFLMGFWVGTVVIKPEIQIAEKEVIKEDRTFCPNVTACVPCLEEPQWDKCEFESFAYEAVRDEINLYGEYELKKGDVYFFSSRGFEYDWSYFCHGDKSNNDCFDYKMIMRKDLFKPIR